MIESETMEMSEHIQGILDNAPTRPGCYIMKDDQGQIIYVGKAINLRNRLRSYFHSSAQVDTKTRKLVSKIIEIEWIVGRFDLSRLGHGEHPFRKTLQRDEVVLTGIGLPCSCTHPVPNTRRMFSTVRSITANHCSFCGARAVSGMKSVGPGFSP